MPETGFKLLLNLDKIINMSNSVLECLFLQKKACTLLTALDIKMDFGKTQSIALLLLAHISLILL